MNNSVPVGMREKFGVFGYFIALAGLIVLQILDAYFGQRLTVLERKLNDEGEKVSQLREGIAARDKIIQETNQTIVDDFEVLVQARLKEIGDELGFRDQVEKTDRVTIYCHDQGGFFVQFGRHSENPIFRRPGKKIRSENEGCIADAWRNGFAYINDLPDFRTDKRGYIARSKAFGLSSNAIRDLTMKARLYCGWRISSRDGASDLAVIIIESTVADRWTREQMLAYKDQENPSLSQTLERVRPRIPEISKAHNVGF